MDLSLQIAVLLFLSGTVGVVYPAWGYSVLLKGLRRIRKKDVHGSVRPIKSASVLLAVYNAENRIVAKTERLIASVSRLTIPCEIVIVLDGCSDKTQEALRPYVNQIVCVVLNERLGKQAALNEAIKIATGDVLVFTDVGAIFADTALKTLLEEISEDGIGAVTCAVSAASPVSDHRTKIADESYLRHDFGLRQMESDLKTTIGCSGALYAVRREHWRAFLPFGASDFQSALDCIRDGAKVKFSDKVLVRLATPGSFAEEFRRKARTINQGLSTYHQCKAYDPRLYGWMAAWMLASHKLIRWFAPCFLALMGIGGAGIFFLIAIEGKISPALAVLMGLAAAASIGALAWRRPQIINSIRFGLGAALGSFVGIMTFVAGRRVRFWQPTNRTEPIEVTERKAG